MDWLKRNWILAAVFLIAAIYIADGFGLGIVSHLKDKAFEKQQAVLMEERKKHVDAGDAAQTRAEIKERDAEIAKLEATISQLGPRAEQLKERIDAEDKKTQMELESAGDSVDPCERVRLTCAKLGIKLEDCTCTTAN